MRARIHSQSSADSGFEPSTLRDRSRDLSTRPPQPPYGLTFVCLSIRVYVNALMVFLKKISNSNRKHSRHADKGLGPVLEQHEDYFGRTLVTLRRFQMMRATPGWHPRPGFRTTPGEGVRLIACCVACNGPHTLWIFMNRVSSLSQGRALPLGQCITTFVKSS
ncbi:hypothetical protein AVEN_246945-1 [Araneus ventricosus]|uniref:Uncharacterized protein n=1 Tax=Araneus ventricosus TaxID=182803 RepID=A0A4Y2SUN1_ARAVE|nr:hypothetical protein AVEN_246945-1 [Araneus ventricosus]